MGGVSLLLFCAAFSYAPYPGGCQTIHLPYSGLHPQGFTVSSYPAATFNELFARIIAHLAPSTEAQSFHHCRRAVSFLCHCRDSRHPHLRAAAWSGWWEDLPQQHKVCATVGRTLPLLYNIHGREYIPVVACPDRSPHPGNGPGQAAHTAQNRAKAGVGGMSGEMDGGTSPSSG